MKVLESKKLYPHLYFTDEQRLHLQQVRDEYTIMRCEIDNANYIIAFNGNKRYLKHRRSIQKRCSYCKKLFMAESNNRTSCPNCFLDHK